MRVSRTFLPLCVLLAVGLPVHADNSMTDSGLSLELIMADPDWKGNEPLNPYWSDDGRFIYYEQKREAETFNDVFRIEVESGAVSEIVDGQLSAIDAADGNYNADFSRKVYVRNGDIFYKDIEEERVVQVTRSAQVESDPRFMPDGRRIVFRAGNDFFRFDPETGLHAQIAELRLEKDPLEEDEYSFLSRQQEDLFDTLRWETRREQSAERVDRLRRNADALRLDEPFYLGSEIEIFEAAISPAATHIVLITQSQDYDPGAGETMPSYVTKDGYVTVQEVRTKVGENEPVPHGIMLLDLAGHERFDIDLNSLPGIQDDPLRELRQTAIEWHVERGAGRETITEQLEAPATRTVQIEQVAWNDQGTAVALQLFAIDNKDRWLVTIDLEDASLVTHERLSFDDGWVNYAHNDFGWSRDGESLWFLSERDGYSHLYTKHLVQRRARQVTAGDFVVESPYLDRAGKNFYVIANREDPGDYRVYRVPAGGREMIQLTPLFAGNEHLLPGNDAPFRLSTDESMLLFRHASANRHPEIFVQENRAGAEARQLSFTMSEQFLSFPWVIPEYVQVPSTNFDGTVHARVYTPDDFDPARKYPAVLFVHGAGYLHNAHQGWSLYFREYMFNNLLREHGFVVLDMDYRGSRGYGSDWRTAIYRNMGHPELEDLVDGVRWLIANKSVDPDRVGIYGGSYGGFMAFMAMFRAAEVFAAGAAVRPVTDWAHYNHEYTSNILNTPLIDPEAYQRSSPIEFAPDFASKPLLIAHGMQDSNVHFQDSVRLVQRLIELQKENFEIAIYPLDPHGFTHADSWLDEYRRIFKLFEQNLGKD